MFYVRRKDTHLYLHRILSDLWLWKIERTGAYAFPSRAAAKEQVKRLGPGKLGRDITSRSLSFERV